MLLTRFVQDMLGIASGRRNLPHAAFPTRRLSPLDSPIALYPKLTPMGLPVPEAVVRLIAAPGTPDLSSPAGLMPGPVAAYAAPFLDSDVMAGTEHRMVAHLPDRWSSRHVSGDR